MRLPASELGKTVKVTPWFEGSLFTATFIVTLFPDPTCTVAVVEVDAVTPVPPIFVDIVIAETTTGADPDFDLSAADVAVMVTVRSLGGGLGGAV